MRIDLGHVASKPRGLGSDRGYRVTQFRFRNAVTLGRPDWRLLGVGVQARLSGMSDSHATVCHLRIFLTQSARALHAQPDRGSYDRELIYSILDQAFVCTVGFIADGLPFVVPTNYVRVGDKLFPAWLDGQPTDENAVAAARRSV